VKAPRDCAISLNMMRVWSVAPVIQRAQRRQIAGKAALIDDIFRISYSAEKALESALWIDRAELRQTG